MDLSTTDTIFTAKVPHWIVGGEVFVVLRYVYSAGAKDYAFVSQWLSFEELLKPLPPKTSVIVMRETQLSLRGKVDDKFISDAQNEMLPDTFFLIVSLHYCLVEHFKKSHKAQLHRDLWAKTI